MKLTTKQLKQIITEEVEICKKEYNICIKDVTDGESDEAIEYMHELKKSVKVRIK